MKNETRVGNGHVLRRERKRGPHYWDRLIVWMATQAMIHRRLIPSEGAVMTTRSESTLLYVSILSPYPLSKEALAATATMVRFIMARIIVSSRRDSASIDLFHRHSSDTGLKFQRTDTHNCPLHIFSERVDSGAREHPSIFAGIKIRPENVNTRLKKKALGVLLSRLTTASKARRGSEAMA